MIIVSEPTGVTLNRQRLALNRQQLMVNQPTAVPRQLALYGSASVSEVGCFFGAGDLKDSTTIGCAKMVRGMGTFILMVCFLPNLLPIWCSDYHLSRADA